MGNNASSPLVPTEEESETKGDPTLMERVISSSLPSLQKRFRESFYDPTARTSKMPRRSLDHTPAPPARSIAISDLIHQEPTEEAQNSAEENSAPQLTTGPHEHNDGHKWRKYGSKKSKTAARSYYKCRYPNCPVKKIVTRETTGDESIQYKDEHTHDPPIVMHKQVASPNELVAIVGQFMRENESADADLLPKLVVNMAASCVDTVPEDGMSWRKYGQKMVKGNPYPRNYYKCANEACIVKRLVELDADGQQYVISYEGFHSHQIQEN